VQGTDVDNADKMKSECLQYAQPGLSHSNMNSTIQGSCLLSAKFLDNSCSLLLADHSGMLADLPGFSPSCGSMNTYTRSQENLDVSFDLSEDTATNQKSEIFNNHKTQGSLLQDIYGIINQLKNLLKEDISKLKANFESKLCIVEENLVEGLKLRHNLMQSSVDGRLHAIEENSHEHSNMMANIESKLSAIEECMSRIPEFGEVICKHSIVQPLEVAKMRTTSLTTIPEETIAMTKDPVAGISSTQDETPQHEHEQKKTYAGSNAIFEDRLSKAENNIDQISSLLDGIEARLSDSVDQMLKKKLTESMHRISTEKSTSIGSMASSLHASEASDAALHSAVEALMRADYFVPPVKENLMRETMTGVGGLEKHQDANA